MTETKTRHPKRAAKLPRLNDDVHREFEEVVKYARQTLLEEAAEARKKARAARKDVLEAYKLRELLRSSGFPDARVQYRGESVRLDTERGRLSALHAVVGKLTVTDKSLDYGDPAKVIVTLVADRHPKLRACYRVPVPTEGRCRVEERTTVYRTLVCSR